MTNTKTTLTDKRQIEEAINHVLAQKIYIPLSKEDFDITCPNPALAVNVVAGSADEAATLLETELARISVRQVSGIIVVLQCISMTMGDLEFIDAVFPHTKQIKRGISFTKPEGTIYLFTLNERNTPYLGVFLVIGKMQIFLSFNVNIS